MTEKTDRAGATRRLYAMELKNKLYECIMTPGAFDEKKADGYYRELMQADSSGNILDKSLSELYFKRKSGKNIGGEIKECRLSELPKSRKNVQWHIIMICAAVIMLSAVFILTFFRAQVLKFTPGVPLPLHSKVMDSEQDWSQYRASMRIACDSLNMKIKFPEWIPPQMECEGVWEYASRNMCRVDVHFVTDKEKYDTAKFGHEVYISVQKIFNNSYNEINSGDSFWPARSQYKIEKINDVDYYICADEDGRSYRAVAVEGQYAYMMLAACDYQTTIKILESIKPF